MLHELRDVFNGSNNLCVVDATFNLYKHHYISSKSKDTANDIDTSTKFKPEAEKQKTSDKVLTGPHNKAISS